MLQEAFLKEKIFKFFTFVLLIFLFVSCNKENVELAKTDVSVMTDVLDHSPVYMFFREENKDTLIEVNTKNVISTTNWVFTIDKRLPLNLVIPEIMELQKRKKQASHKNPEAINVFSYTDSIKRSLAFLPFTDVQYKFGSDFSKFYIKDNASLYMDYNNVTVNFNKDNMITVDGSDVERTDFVAYIKDFADFMSAGKTTIIHLNFDKHLSFDEYIQNKILAWQLTSDKIQLSSYEFVYDDLLLPDCGCKL